MYVYILNCSAVRVRVLLRVRGTVYRRSCEGREEKMARLCPGIFMVEGALGHDALYWNSCVLRSILRMFRERSSLLLYLYYYAKICHSKNEKIS